MKTWTIILSAIMLSGLMAGCGQKPKGDHKTNSKTSQTVDHAKKSDHKEAKKPMTKLGKYFTTKDNVAIEGYDLVGYFQNKAVKGSAEHSVEHDGVIYHFANAENKKTFQSDPKKYLPQYGGFCAFGMAKMKAKVPINPTTFAIHKGKLLLFFNGPYKGKNFNTKTEWEKDKDGILKEADVIWKKIK